VNALVEANRRRVFKSFAADAALARVVVTVLVQVVLLQVHLHRQIIIILYYNYADFKDTAAVYEFYSLHPRRVVYPTFKVSYIMNTANND